MFNAPPQNQCALVWQSGGVRGWQEHLRPIAGKINISKPEGHSSSVLFSTPKFAARRMSQFCANLNTFAMLANLC